MNNVSGLHKNYKNNQYKNWNEISILEMKWFVETKYNSASTGDLILTSCKSLRLSSTVHSITLNLHKSENIYSVFTSQIFSISTKRLCNERKRVWKRCLIKNQNSFSLFFFLSCLLACLPAFLSFLVFPIPKVSLLNSHLEIWTCKECFSWLITTEDCR